jgi:hypothetical protein
LPLTVDIDGVCRSLTIPGSSSVTVNQNKALSVQIPTRVYPPPSGRLFLVGDATTGGWLNPVPIPDQEFTNIDGVTFGGIFDLKADKHYLFLPNNGDWSSKYACPNATVPDVRETAFFYYYYSGGNDFPSPTVPGLYKIMVDFENGKYHVTPFNQQYGLPATLYITGSATPAGAVSTVPVPSQQCTRLTSTKFEITIPLVINSTYMFISENGNLNKKFGIDGSAANTTFGGVFKPDGDSFTSPSTSGTYKITIDFFNNTYKLVKQ